MRRRGRCASGRAPRAGDPPVSNSTRPRWVLISQQAMGMGVGASGVLAVEQERAGGTHEAVLQGVERLDGHQTRQPR